MKRYIRFISVMLALTLTVILTSCWLLEEPFGEDGATETATDILWDPQTTTSAQTDASSDVSTDASSDVSSDASSDVSSDVPVETTTSLPDETAPAPAIRTLWGTVVEYEAVEPMENVLAVEVYLDGKNQRIHLYTERASEFCVHDEVTFTYDAGQPMDSYDGHSVWEAISIDYAPIAVPEKPVIYLYPETPTEVSVKLTVDGKLTCTYPAYDKGWDHFVAHPDGTLIFPDGKEYYCLYWEGIQNMDCDFSKGFCVKGSDTAAFLEWALSEQGLTPREANEFIIYWLPRMESNPYNVISFQADAYTEGAVLEIDPNPDSLLRVFMAYYPSDEAVEMEAQEFTPFERVGFAVVEWGGCELTEAP